ncbi:MAG: RNA-binding protein [Desulfuromonadales bacterium]|nr:RNA-binding protein [Desulfuromonadales bacterium]MDT8424274.1 RNA-binding protein [Desulfuromonadales bacterium]
MGKDVFVDNLPFETTEDELRTLFTVAGTVGKIHLQTDPRSGKFKGCGFVKMANAAQAQEAITVLDGALLHNRLIAVSAVRAKQPPASESAAAMEPPPKRKAPRRR